MSLQDLEGFSEYELSDASGSFPLASPKQTQHNQNGATTPRVGGATPRGIGSGRVTTLSTSASSVRRTPSLGKPPLATPRGGTPGHSANLSSKSLGREISTASSAARRGGGADANGAAHSAAQAGGVPGGSADADLPPGLARGDRAAAAAARAGDAAVLGGSAEAGGVADGGDVDASNPFSFDPDEAVTGAEVHHRKARCVWWLLHKFGGMHMVVACPLSEFICANATSLHVPWRFS